MSAPTPKTGAKPSRRGAVISGVVTVAVLAAVIIGAAALSPSDDAPAPKISLQTAPSSQSVQLTEQGEQALAAGDTAGAAVLAKQALQSDPTNQAARALLTKATTAQKSASGSQGSGTSNKGSSGGTGSGDSTNGAPSGGAGSGGSGPNPDAGYTKKISNMGKVLPASFAKYFLGDAMVTQSEAQVSATPVSGTQIARQITWTLHEGESKADAERFVSAVSKQSFGNDGASVSIDGAPGYFGTDGTRYATCVYVRGRYAFEVLVTGNDKDPKELRTLAQEAAKAFQD